MAVVLASLVLAYQRARPAVPAQVVMSTGAAGGAYDAFAQRYVAALAEEGVKLRLVPSKGAVDNLARLEVEGGEVDLAFVQNGLANRDKTQDGALASLGSMFYEPVLLFYRPRAFAQPLTSLAGLQGKTVAAGPPGSGTRVLAQSLMDLHKLGTATVLRAEGGQDAANALKAGSVDAAFFVGSTSAPLIEALFRDRTLAVADLALADTYARRLPQVAAVTLPPGVIDVPSLLPARAVRTVAATSSLVVREDLHPAVVFLLMRAARKIHSGADSVAPANTFPNLTLQQDFPPSPEAERFLREGTPFLYRYLPFKLANFASRAVLFLIPLLALLLPLTDWIPKLIGMRVKRKLFRHYGDMKQIDEQVRTAGSAAQLDAASAQLDALDAAVGRLRIPLAYGTEQFGVRDHMDLLRVRIERQRAALQEATLQEATPQQSTTHEAAHQQLAQQPAPPPGTTAQVTSLAPARAPQAAMQMAR